MVLDLEVLYELPRLGLDYILGLNGRKFVDTEKDSNKDKKTRYGLEVKVRFGLKRRAYDENSSP